MAALGRCHAVTEFLGKGISTSTKLSWLPSAAVCMNALQIAAHARDSQRFAAVSAALKHLLLWSLLWNST